MAKEVAVAQRESVHRTGVIPGAVSAGV